MKRGQISIYMDGPCDSMTNSAQWGRVGENTQTLDQKVNQRQNTVCLEQQIYASPENFTPTLLVVLETFRRSAIWCPYLAGHHI